MCGIAGLAGKWTAEQLAILSGSMKHRGPDDSGDYSDLEGGVALAMRRLSIIDLESGHQPMSNEDGSVWIVYNGEVYNSPELRPPLEANGHRFQTSHSDTECLIHLYEDKQERMLNDLNGMFAFVIYDRQRQRLFGARDRFGIKPLYYTQQHVPQGQQFAFASELKSLLLLPSVPRTLNLQSLYHYLSLRYVPGPESIFKGIFRLPAGHYFTYDLVTGELRVERYWRPDVTQAEDRPLGEWVERIRSELGQAARRWVLSDVPVACSLSGGLDSTTLVALLSSMGYPQLRTYSLGFQGNDEQDLNELALARQVAKQWGTDHHELILTPDQLLDDLIPMVWYLDEPYGGGLPSWYVFKFMGRDVKVGLTGTGGDELFGAYGKWLPYERVNPTFPRSAGEQAYHVARRAAGVLPAAVIGDSRKRRFNDDYQPVAREMDSFWMYLSDAAKREQVIAFNGQSIDGTADRLQQLYEESGATHVYNGVTYVLTQTQLPEEFLLMTDRFSMAHSLEARVPFLDHQFVEQMLRIPPLLRTQPGDLKYLLRRAVRDLLPEPLLAAPKRGFVIPDTLWLRGKLRPVVEKLLGPEALARQGLFKPTLYENMVRPHLDGKADNTGQVWTLLMFQLWHLVYIEQQATELPSWMWRDV